MNRAQHPILRWLPLKLAKWIGDNYGPRLASCWNLPSKSRRQEDSLTQNVAQLNAILEHNLILSTKSFADFRVQWKCYGQAQSKVLSLRSAEAQAPRKNPQLVDIIVISAGLICSGTICFSCCACERFAQQQRGVNSIQRQVEVSMAFFSRLEPVGYAGQNDAAAKCAYALRH